MLKYSLSFRQYVQQQTSTRLQASTRMHSHPYTSGTEDPGQIETASPGGFWTPTRLILVTAIFLVLTANAEFFSKVAEVYPWGDGNIRFNLSVGMVLGSLLAVLMALMSLSSADTHSRVDICFARGHDRFLRRPLRHCSG